MNFAAIILLNCWNLTWKPKQSNFQKEIYRPNTICSVQCSISMPIRWQWHQQQSAFWIYPFICRNGNSPHPHHSRTSKNQRPSTYVSVFVQPLWKILASWDYYSQYFLIYEKNMFQTTNQFCWWRICGVSTHALGWSASDMIRCWPAIFSPHREVNMEVSNMPCSSFYRHSVLWVLLVVSHNWFFVGLCHVNETSICESVATCDEVPSPNADHSSTLRTLQTLPCQSAQWRSSFQQMMFR